MSYQTLGEIAELTPGFAFKAKDFGSGTAHVIKIADINHAVNADNLQTVSLEPYDASKLKKFICKPGDYLVAMTGNTIGKIGRIERGEAYANQRVLKIQTSDSKVICPEYLWALLQLPGFQAHIINHIDSHSAQPNISAKSIGSYKVAIPSLEKQMQISAILESIRQRIAINVRLNGYLEELCDCLFADCFGGLPENAALSDIAEITMGQSPAGSSYNENGIGTVFYQGRAEFGWRYPTQRLMTTEPKRIASKGDVLMSVRAPVGDLNLAYEDCCIGRGLAAIHCAYPSYCLYLMRSLRKKLDAYNGEGTVFGSINGKALRALPIALPSEKEIAQFEAKARPLDAQIMNSETESRTLTSLRDTLLPKLMSGEIDVSDIDLTQLNSHLADC